ncbi:MAG TPA: chemotaxis protein CheW [Candidatus Acidoferrales bacterium]|nr:chemotaxis protein CheW [Candidatus Acidoferrales bacterium]
MTTEDLRFDEAQQQSKHTAPDSQPAEPEPLELLPVPEGLEPLGGDGREDEVSPESQYCVFRAGRERFCLAVLAVEEVVDWPQVTRIPLCPSFLMGVFNLRGSIVPLVDIAFTEGRRPGLLPKQVVVASLRDEAHGANVRIGIAADEVIGTYTAADDSLLDQMPNEVPHCRGMLRHDDRLALVLDLPKMVNVFPVPVI